MDNLDSRRGRGVSSDYSGSNHSSALLWHQTIHHITKGMLHITIDLPIYMACIYF